jgi:organic hydroperoxide reductase OsmC/OhrA
VSDKTHSYEVRVRWTGNRGDGTRTYAGYGREHEIVALGKPILLGSSDAAFRGDRSRYNPEELLVASLSACHMLWYLHLCSSEHIVVVQYLDAASGVMLESTDGSGRFSEVVLRPQVVIEHGGDTRLAIATVLHEKAHRMCFIANSVNFSVRCEPIIRVGANLPAPER